MGNSNSNSSGGGGGGGGGGSGGYPQAPGSGSAGSGSGAASASASPHARRLEQEFARLAEPSTQSLSRASFHRALEAVEVLGFKRLRETPLGELLFEAHAVNEALSAASFRAAMEATLSASPSTRLLTSFRVIAGRENENAMPISRLVEFFERSWQTASQTLVEKLQLAKQTETATLVQQFAAKNAATLSQTLRSEFSRSGEFVSRAEFTRFMAEDRNVVIALKDVAVEVPTSFLFLQKPVPAAYPSMASK